MKLTKQMLREMIEEELQYVSMQEADDAIEGSGYADGKKEAQGMLIAFRAGEITEPTEEELLAIIAAATEGKSADYAQMYKHAFNETWSATLTPQPSLGQLPFANARDSKGIGAYARRRGRNPLYTLEETRRKPVRQAEPTWGLPPDPDLEP